MRFLIAAAALAIAPGALHADDPIAFTKADAGKLPKGWSAAKTGQGEGSRWEVAAEPTAPSGSGFALTQLAAGPTALYNLCVLDGSSFKDGEVSVRVKAIKGDIDQGGGVAWRYRDPDNYYVCRYNPLEENFRVYFVKGGKRTQLATKGNVTVPAGKWFEVSVRHAGDKIECSLNGTKHLEATDGTFTAAGKAVLWTKADAVTAFDRLTIGPPRK